jgi:hypothetical protein
MRALNIHEIKKLGSCMIKSFDETVKHWEHLYSTTLENNLATKKVESVIPILSIPFCLPFKCFFHTLELDMLVGSRINLVVQIYLFFVVFTEWMG